MRFTFLKILGIILIFFLVFSEFRTTENLTAQSDEEKIIERFPVLSLTHSRMIHYNSQLNEVCHPFRTKGKNYFICINLKNGKHRILEENNLPANTRKFITYKALIKTSVKVAYIPVKPENLPDFKSANYFESKYNITAFPYCWINDDQVLVCADLARTLLMRDVTGSPAWVDKKFLKPLHKKANLRRRRKNIQKWLKLSARGLQNFVKDLNLLAFDDFLFLGTEAWPVFDKMGEYLQCRDVATADWNHIDVIAKFNKEGVFVNGTTHTGKISFIPWDLINTKIAGINYISFPRNVENLEEFKEFLKLIAATQMLGLVHQGKFLADKRKFVCWLAAHKIRTPLHLSSPEGKINSIINGKFSKAFVTEAKSGTFINAVKYVRGYNFYNDLKKGLFVDFNPEFSIANKENSQVHFPAVFWAATVPNKDFISYLRKFDVVLILPVKNYKMNKSLSECLKFCNENNVKVFLNFVCSLKDIDNNEEKLQQAVASLIDLISRNNLKISGFLIDVKINEEITNLFYDSLNELLGGGKLTAITKLIRKLKPKTNPETSERIAKKINSIIEKMKAKNLKVWLAVPDYFLFDLIDKDADLQSIFSLAIDKIRAHKFLFKFMKPKINKRNKRLEFLPEFHFGNSYVYELGKILKKHFKNNALPILGPVRFNLEDKQIYSSFDEFHADAECLKDIDFGVFSAEYNKDILKYYFKYEESKTEIKDNNFTKLNKLFWITLDKLVDSASK